MLRPEQRPSHTNHHLAREEKKALTFWFEHRLWIYAEKSIGSGADPLPKQRRLTVKLDRKVRCEPDGGERKKVKSFKVKVASEAITVCLPAVGGGKDA